MGRIGSARTLELPRRKAIPGRVGTPRRKQRLITKRLLSLALTLVVAGAFAGCTDDPSSKPSADPSCAPPSAIPLPSFVPDEFPITDNGTPIRAEKTKRGVNVDAISELKIVELYPVFARAVVDAGYEIRFGENEGFEAEVFFVSKKAFGAFRFRKTDCKGQVLIRLFWGER